MPLESENPVPITADPTKSSINVVGSEVPLNVGLVSVVTLSESDCPVSLSLLKSGFDGAEISVSIVIFNGISLSVTFPTASVDLAVIS